MWIKEYVLTIAVTVLFSVLAESVMPETKMKKHISLVAGVIILLVIARPVLSVAENFERFFSAEGEDAEITSSPEIGSRLENAYSSEIQADFFEKTGEAIGKDIENSLYVKCRIRLEQKPDGALCVYADTTRNESIEKLIRDRYGFECYFAKGG